MAVAESDSLQKVHWSVHVKGAGITELSQKVQRMAFVFTYLNDDPGIFDIFFCSILNFFLGLIERQSAELDRTEVGHVNVAVAVHPASRRRLDIAELRIG